MKTKEEILEHLKTAMYNQSARSCIYGWLIGIKICSPENLPYIESLGSKDGAHTFDDFLAWVDKEDKKEDKNFKFGNAMDGCVHCNGLSTPSNALVHKMITPMGFLKTLSRILPEKGETEPAHKVAYVVICNGHRYEIIADEVKEFADALCFFIGEEKVASFPPRAPWFKI